MSTEDAICQELITDLSNAGLTVAVAESLTGWSFVRGLRSRTGCLKRCAWGSLYLRDRYEAFGFEGERSTPCADGSR